MNWVGPEFWRWRQVEVMEAFKVILNYRVSLRPARAKETGFSISVTGSN